MKVNRVWGIATGKGSTEGAAAGAFTSRAYPVEQKIPGIDWLAIMIVERDVDAYTLEEDEFKQAMAGHATTVP